MPLDGSLPISAYILAGGRSTRMGSDKALLELAGKPLVQHATTKLKRLTNEVKILSNTAELSRFAPLVSDLHESCGPLGGIESALAHSRTDWTLVLPVDMPFLPTSLLAHWAHEVIARPFARLALFTVDGRPYPTLSLLHRDVASFVQEAVNNSRLKLYPVLEDAAQKLSASLSQPIHDVFLNRMWDDTEATWSVVSKEASWQVPTREQLDATHLWFANLNTPEEFREAEQHIDALDT